jgi:hypothetical protein
VKKENEIRGYSAVLTFLDEHLKGQQPVTGDSAVGVPVKVGNDSTKAGKQ